MTPRNFDGAIYAAADAGGECIAIFPDRMETYGGTRLPPCPQGGPLAPQAKRIAGRFCLAGKAYAGPAWLWNGFAWIKLTDKNGDQIPAHGGMNTCAFGPLGLYVSTPTDVANVRVFDPLTGAEIRGHVITTPLGVEGIALVSDNGLVHPANGWYGRHGFGFYTEFETVHGPIRIGQGANGGLIAQINNGPLKLLEAGSWEFITVTMTGETFSVAASQFPIHRAVARWYSVTEIHVSPDYAPAPDPEPDPDPEPEPVAYQQQAPDITNLLRQVARDNPEAWADAYEYSGHKRTDRFVKLAAAAAHQYDARFGLNGKRGGNTISADVLAFKNPTVPAHLGGVELRDFIADDGKPGSSDEKHEIRWTDVTVIKSASNPNGVPGKWIAPPDVMEPEPDPDEPDTPIPDPALLARIKALEADVRRLEAENAQLRQTPVHPSYDDMMRLIRDVSMINPHLGGETYAHFVWRFLLERYTVDQLVQDARDRL